jgi:ribosome maturation protein Sdo1
VQKCVDANTGLPLTFGVVERALREVHFAVHLAKTAKQQALAAIKILEQSFPIARAKMRVRVELSASAKCLQVPCPPLSLFPPTPPLHSLSAASGSV